MSGLRGVKNYFVHAGLRSAGVRPRKSRPAALSRRVIFLHGRFATGGRRRTSVAPQPPDADEKQALFAARAQVLLDHRRHVPRSERVQIQFFFHWHANESRARYLSWGVFVIVRHGRPRAAAAKYAGRYSESPSSRRL